MVTLAGPHTARWAGVRRRRSTRRAVGHVLCSVLMIVAMVPCVAGGGALAHGSAAMLLFALAVGQAPAARHEARARPDVVDALAMAALSVAAALCAGSTAGATAGAAPHMHTTTTIIGADTVVVVLAVAGWLALRLAVEERSGGMSRRRVHGVVSAAMVVTMAAMTLAHALSWPAM